MCGGQTLVDQAFLLRSFEEVASGRASGVAFVSVPVQAFPSSADTPLSRLAFLARFSQVERFTVESYCDSTCECFMHGDVRERMASIPVLMKIIVQPPTSSSGRVCARSFG
jgi:hypothetical protein